MVILNFSHPLTPAQVADIERLTGRKVERVVDIKVHFDHEKPFAEQAQAMVESIGLSVEEWQTTRLLVNLPSLNTIAALVLAELHGRMGYFPAVVRLKPIADTAPPQFEVAEILNLQAARDGARKKR